MKKAVERHLRGRGRKILDADGYSGKAYFEVAESAAKAVASGGADGAVLFCGTGAGMAIVANKIRGIRAVCVESVFAAQKAKAINDANVISMGAMIVGESMACAMADAWLDANFADGFEELRGFLETAARKSVGNRRRQPRRTRARQINFARRAPPAAVEISALGKAKREPLHGTNWKPFSPAVYARNLERFSNAEIFQEI